MQNIKWDRLLILVVGVGLIWFLSQGGVINNPFNPTPVVVAPPFKTDKPAALIVWESDPIKIVNLSSGQRDVIEGTAEGTVKALLEKSGGYPVQVVDRLNIGVDFSYPWMKEARLVEMKSLPWMVMATPKSGLSIPLDKDVTTEKVVNQLKPLLEDK